MGREASLEAARVVAVWNCRLQSALKSHKWLGRTWGQPEREPVAPVGELIERLERDRERLEVAAGLGEPGGDGVEVLPRPEGVEWRDVRHPPMELLIVTLADGLDGSPDLAWWDDDDGRVMRLHGVSLALIQSTTRPGIASLFAWVSSHTSTSGRRFRLAMNPPP